MLYVYKIIVQCELTVVCYYSWTQFTQKLFRA